VGGVVNPLTALVPFDGNVGAASVSGGGGGAHVGERPGLVWDSRSADLFFSPLYNTPSTHTHPVLSSSRSRGHSLSFKRISAF
jgi:hypothetical protein